MSNTSRRGFLGALAVSGATLAASRAAAAPDKLDLSSLKKDTDIACLYHCDFGDPAAVRAVAHQHEQPPERL